MFAAAAEHFLAGTSSPKNWLRNCPVGLFWNDQALDLRERKQRISFLRTAIAIWSNEEWGRLGLIVLHRCLHCSFALEDGWSRTSVSSPVSSSVSEEARVKLSASIKWSAIAHKSPARSPLILQRSTKFATSVHTTVSLISSPFNCVTSRTINYVCPPEDRCNQEAPYF